MQLMAAAQWGRQPVVQARMRGLRLGPVLVRQRLRFLAQAWLAVAAVDRPSEVERLRGAKRVVALQRVAARVVGQALQRVAARGQPRVRDLAAIVRVAREPGPGPVLRVSVWD